MRGAFCGDLHAIDGQTALVVLRDVERINATCSDLKRTRIDEDRIRHRIRDVRDHWRGKALVRQVAEEGTRDDGTGRLSGVRHRIQCGIGTSEFTAEGSGQTTLREARRRGRAEGRLNLTVNDIRDDEDREGCATVDSDGLASTEDSAGRIGELGGTVITRGRAIQRRVEGDRRTRGEGIVAAEEDAAIARVDRTGRIRETAAHQRQVGVGRGEDLQARRTTGEQCTRAHEGHVVSGPADAGQVKDRVRRDVQRTHQDRIDLIVGTDIEQRGRQVAIVSDVVTEGDDGIVAKVCAQGKLTAVDGNGARAEDVRLTGLLEADQRAIIKDEATRGRRLGLGVVAPTGRGREAGIIAKPERAEAFLRDHARPAHAATEDQ